jgi:hypothetical protein
VIRLPISSGQITIVDLNDTIVSSTQPSDPIDGTLWLDTSVTPNVLKVYRTGVGWVKATPTTPDEVGAVSPSGIIAAINASGEQVKIQGTKIDITGQVTFNSLSSGLQQSFNSDGTVKTSRLSGTISDSQIASASTWNTIKDRVNSWTTASTKINGGLIETNTIVASSLVLSDFTNLCENPDFESDTVGSNPKGYTTNSSCRVADISGFSNGNGSNRALEIDAKNGSNNDIYTSNIFPVRPNQQFYVEAEARYLNTAGTGWLRIGFRRYDDKKQPLSSWQEVVKWDGTKVTSFTKKSGTYTVPSGTGYLQIWISFLNNGETTNKAYIDNIRVHRMAGGELIVDGTIEAKHIKSLNGLNVNDQFVVDTNGNVSVANDKVTLDTSGVTVQDGSFALTQTENSGIWKTVWWNHTAEPPVLESDPDKPFKNHLINMPNLIADHSFEMVPRDVFFTTEGWELWTVPDEYESFGKWATAGYPKLQSFYQTDASFSQVPFGYQQAVVHDSNYFYQSVSVMANKTYTLSFHTNVNHGRSQIGQPRVVIKFLDEIGNNLYGDWEFIFPTPSLSGYAKAVRHAITFTVPADLDEMTSYPAVTIELKGYNGWVCFDGIQLVECDKPVDYVSEDMAYAMRRGADKYPIINAIGTEGIKVPEVVFNQGLALRQLNSGYIHVRTEDDSAYGDIASDTVYTSTGFSGGGARVTQKGTNVVSWYGFASNGWAIMQKKLVTVSLSNSAQDYADFTWDKAFTSAIQMVQATTIDSSSTVYNCGVYNITKTGARLYVTHIHNTNATINIQAHVLALGD